MTSTYRRQPRPDSQCDLSSFLRGNIFNQAFAQSATATQSTSRVGTTGGATNGGFANGGAASGGAINDGAATAGADAAGASSADGDTKEGRRNGLTNRLDNPLEGANEPGKLVQLLACNEDALKGFRGLDIAPTMVVESRS
ncbi:hypothetical protein CLOM_g14909 [Closterium sp. NIES-68]|nr:hypothetical protein CLOM_g14909 [Closterium sp. NIES-68]GJP75528.1 hypothetical protein CLOP_g5962 [Closterium sp. NIES-67]